MLKTNIFPVVDFLESISPPQSASDIPTKSSNLVVYLVDCLIVKSKPSSLVFNK